MSGALYLSLIGLYLCYVEEDVEAEMRRLKQELEQTMNLYSSACKEALSAKQKAVELRQKVKEEHSLDEARKADEATMKTKPTPYGLGRILQGAVELHRWKVEEEHRQDEARKAEEAAMAILEREKAKTKAAIEASKAAQRLAEREAQKRINELAQTDNRYRKYTSQEDVEAEMRRLKQELKQTMNLYRLARKEALSAKQKAVLKSGVGVAVAIDKDKGSQFALKWAIDHLLARGQTVTLIHVKQKPSSIPTPMGSHVSLSDVHDEVAQAIKKQMDNQAKEIFLPFRAFCTRKDIKTNEIVIEDTDVARALCDYVKINLIKTLVVGSPSRNSFVKFKSSVVPTSVSRGAPEFCSVYVISKGKVSSVRSATIAVPTQQIRSHIQISHAPRPTDTSSVPARAQCQHTEMTRMKQELKQTMDMYSSTCKEALSAKQKVVELRWKVEEEHSLDEARKADEATMKTKPTPYGLGGILQGVGLLALLFISFSN